MVVKGKVGFGPRGQEGGLVFDDAHGRHVVVSNVYIIVQDGLFYFGFLRALYFCRWWSRTSRGIGCSCCRSQGL